MKVLRSLDWGLVELENGGLFVVTELSETRDLYLVAAHGRAKHKITKIIRDEQERPIDISYEGEE